MFAASLLFTTLMVLAPITSILRWRTIAGPEVTSLVALAGLVGTWMMTAPDPGALAERRGVDARRFARWAVTVALLGNVAAIVRAPLTALGGSFPLFAVVYLLFGVAAVAAEWAKYTYIAQLARRVPDETLAKVACRVRVIFPIARIVATLPVATTLLAQVKVPWAVACLPFVGMVYLAGLCAVIVCAIGGLILVSRFRRVIAREAVVAGEIWRRGMRSGA